MRRWAVVVMLVVGCKKAPAVPDAGAPAPRDEVAPVYPMQVAEQPLAVRFCKAMHAVPADRRSTCCQAPKASDVVERECVRMLSAALGDQSVTLAEPALAACEAAIAAAHEGCDWAGGAGFEAPEACATVLAGTLADGARCRSSVECGAGRRCVGVGPTDPGKCAPPSIDHTLCAISVDALAAVTFQRLDDAHPECAGMCGRRKCEPVVDAGAPCTTNVVCGAGRHCAGTCVAGPYARDGEACVQGACAPGLRCLGGKCRVPAFTGAACTHDAECRGACLDGNCAPKCR